VRSSEGQTSACLLIVQLADQTARDLSRPLWSRFFLSLDGRENLARARIPLSHEATDSASRRRARPPSRARTTPHTRSRTRFRLDVHATLAPALRLARDTPGGACISPDGRTHPRRDAK
jgi:hypothetical protein